MFQGIEGCHADLQTVIATTIHRFGYTLDTRCDAPVCLRDGVTKNHLAPTSHLLTQVASRVERLLDGKALVDLTSQFLEVDGERHPLAPGMQVSAEIHLGTRTVLEYLLSPVTKAFHESARER